MDKNKYIQLFEKYLVNEASQLEIKALVDWLKGEDASNWMETEWDNADSEFSPSSSMKKQEIYNKVLQEIDIDYNIGGNSSPKQFSNRKLFSIVAKVAIAASLLLATSVLGYKLAQLSSLPKDTIVAASRGQKASVVLPDGSLVWLNSESQIKYGSQFTDKERVVSIKGEAYFEVAKDSDRPFIVEASDLKIKVHGTSFNVNTYDSNILKVALLEGSLEVQTERNQPQMLRPNEVAVYNSLSNKIEVNEGFANEFIDWKFNRIRFKDEDFASIVHFLERSFDVVINVEDASLKTRRFTGDFSQNETIEQILDVMSSTNRYNYTISGNKVDIY